jgi:hypothetical protein
LKTHLFILSLVCLSLASCKKESGWDTALNGTWEEVSNNNTRALPSNCNLEFQNDVMVICNESLGEDLNQESRVHAQDGQIWISYRLSFRKHEEYRYDYQLEGEYLWIMEETSSTLNSISNNSKAKKYRKR